MSFCRAIPDHPIRVQFGKGLVIHAARKETCGGYDRRDYTGPGVKIIHISEREVVRIACRWEDIPKEYVVKNTTPITCKQCLKALGMFEKEASPKRFVVKRRDTGEYFQKKRHCPKWVDNILDATMYKVKPAAESHTKRVFYRDTDGNEVPYGEYCKRQKTDEQIIRTIEKHSNYEVKTVKITVE